MVAVLEPAAEAKRVVTASGPAAALPVFVIGERTYRVAELSLEGFFALGDLVADNVELIAAQGLLDPATWDGFKASELAALIPKILPLWRQAPAVVGKALAIVLEAAEPDAAEYILRHLRLFSQLPAVLDAFGAANPVGDLFSSFFRLRALAGATQAGDPATTTS